MASISS